MRIQKAKISNTIAIDKLCYNSFLEDRKFMHFLQGDIYAYVMTINVDEDITDTAIIGFEGDNLDTTKDFAEDAWRRLYDSHINSYSLALEDIEIIE